MYHDRRTEGVTVDASKCIWIMASNLGDNAAEKFYFKNMAGKKDEEACTVAIEPLKQKLERVFRESYSVSPNLDINKCVTKLIENSQR